MQIVATDYRCVECGKDWTLCVCHVETDLVLLDHSINDRDAALIALLADSWGEA